MAFRTGSSSSSSRGVQEGKSILEGSLKDFPKTSTLPEYFSEGFLQGRVHPNKTALVEGEKRHTFHQLNDISQKIGAVILECVRGQGKSVQNPDGDPVIGVCLQPSDRLIAILFGILYSGAAYLPFDITFPEERILKIVRECRPLVVICDDRSSVLAKFDSAKEHTLVWSREELYQKIRGEVGRHREVLQALDVARDDHGGHPKAEDIAIILYTSGSSGEPKGVRLSHRAVMNRLSWQWTEFPFTPAEKCVFKTSLTFVDSVAEIFGPLLQGRQLTIFDKFVTSQPPLFMEKLHAYGITRVVLVPSLLKAIFQSLSILGRGEGRKLLDSVRHWVCSGETLSYDLLSEFFHHFPENFTLSNLYGSTEVMGDVTFISFSSMAEVQDKCGGKRVPIGFPLQNTSIYILNEQLQPVEEGSLGQVFVSGCNLATGYVGIPVSDKFPTNTVHVKADDKMYSTGDFGRIAQVGTLRVLMYEGRIDSQIKVRGQRVDLSEIEAVISSFEAVAKVKVLCYRAGEEDQAVVAYIVPASQPITTPQISRKMAKSLREYELPLVRLIPEIPLLVNGKTDRQRLLKMYEAERKNGEEFDNWESLALPENKLSQAKTLLRVMSQVTGTSIQVLGENFEDSFFNVGGTSLNTVVVIVQLREHNYYISIPEFTLATSIRQILDSICLMENAQERGEDGENKKGEGYTVDILTDEDEEEVVDIISYSFSKRGDLEAYVNVTYSDFAKLIKSIWGDIVEKQLSFIVRRGETGKAVAVSLAFDVYDEPNEVDCTEGIKYVMDFLEHVESQQRSLLPSGKGKLLHSFMMGTPEDVDDFERVFLIEFMEEQNVLLAKDHQFIGILTTNTNPLTMQIGRDVQGYEILCEYQVNEYVAPNGVKPFALAPDSFHIICCWKRLE